MGSFDADSFAASLLADLESGRLDLPTLPEVALRVRDAVEDESTSAGEVADAIASDTALSARLLQIVNSPLYRGRQPIDNLRTAVARLGYAQVRNLVTSLAMRQMFQATDEILDRYLWELWEHSVEVASISATLARSAGLPRDQAMLAGLIHDVGALPILARAEEEPALLADEALLGQTLRALHTGVGAGMLRAWDFPEPLVAVAAEHEDLQRDPGGPADLVDLVIAANLQSRLGRPHPLGSVDWATVPAFARLGIDTEVEIVEIGGAGELQAILGTG